MVAGSFGSKSAKSLWNYEEDTIGFRLKVSFSAFFLSILRQNLMHFRNFIQPPFMNQILNTGSLGSDPGCKGLHVPVK